jgi:hypothetical protein
MHIFLAGEGGKDRQEMLVKLGGKILVSYFYSERDKGVFSTWYKGLINAKREQLLK